MRSLAEAAFADPIEAILALSAIMRRPSADPKSRNCSRSFPTSPPGAQSATLLFPITVHRKIKGVVFFQTYLNTTATKSHRLFFCTKLQARLLFIDILLRFWYNLGTSTYSQIRLRLVHTYVGGMCLCTCICFRHIFPAILVIHLHPHTRINS